MFYYIAKVDLKSPLFPVLKKQGNPTLSSTIKTMALNGCKSTTFVPILESNFQLAIWYDFSVVAIKIELND